MGKKGAAGRGQTDACMPEQPEMNTRGGRAETRAQAEAEHADGRGSRPGGACWGGNGPGAQTWGEPSAVELREMQNALGCTGISIGGACDGRERARPGSRTCEDAGARPPFGLHMQAVRASSDRERRPGDQDFFDEIDCRRYNDLKRKYNGIDMHSMAKEERYKRSYYRDGFAGHEPAGTGWRHDDFLRDGNFYNGKHGEEQWEAPRSAPEHGAGEAGRSCPARYAGGVERPAFSPPARPEPPAATMPPSEQLISEAFIRVANTFHDLRDYFKGVSAQLKHDPLYGSLAETMGAQLNDFAGTLNASSADYLFYKECEYRYRRGVQDRVSASFYHNKYKAFYEENKDAVPVKHLARIPGPVDRKGK
ncbi:hypothetical protein PAPHI01_2190 [Pancytospora philotis]|nr:hypothetical protein PAPHI01_2190 [Pancytospora philotis]